MFRHLGLVLALALFAPLAFAAQVTKVKGKSALINLQGTAASPGDAFYAMDGGKKKALIRISKIKGDKAIGKIEKGNAAAGMSLQAASGGGGSKTAGGASSSSASPTMGAYRSYWGAMFGIGMDSMTVQVNRYSDGVSLGSAALSGIGFSAKGLFDYELFPHIWFRGLGGIEMFNASGPSSCGENNAQVCDAKIMYLSGDFVGRYVFSDGAFRPWVGFGIGLLFPMSKSATALASNSIGTTNVMLPQLGLDWFLSPNMYIPISVEYGMLPKSDEVDGKWIAVRAGFAVPF